MQGLCKAFRLKNLVSCNVSNEWLTGRSRLDKCFDPALKAMVVVGGSVWGGGSNAR